MIRLLLFTCWVQAKFDKNATFSVKVGKRIPAVHKNYNSGTKIYSFDAVNQTQLNIIQISYKGKETVFDLNKYPNCVSQPHVELVQDYRIFFTWQLLSSTDKLYNKYCSQKSQFQKHFYCQGLNDFIRSEQQFLALFERNQQIQQLRHAQQEQSQVQRQLLDLIMASRKINLSILKIVVVFVIFLIFGYAFGKYQSQNGSIIDQIFGEQPTYAHQFKKNQKRHKQNIKEKQNKLKNSKESSKQKGKKK